MQYNTISVPVSPFSCQLQVHIPAETSRDVTHAELTLGRKPRWRKRRIPLPTITLSDPDPSAEDDLVKHVDLFRNTVDVFDVTKLLQKWSKQSDSVSNTTLKLNITSRGTMRALTRTYSLRGRRRDRLPVMLLYKNLTGPLPNEETTPQRKTRRSSPIRNIEELEEPCNIREWRLHFNLIGWDWMLQPESYLAGVCEGSCNLPEDKHLVTTTNHAYLVSMLRQRKKRYSRLLPTPKCVPMKSAPMSVLYINSDGNIVIDTLESMVVTACGCL